MSERARNVAVVLAATILAVAVVIAMTVLSNSITSTRATIDGSVELLAPRTARSAMPATATSTTTATSPTIHDDGGHRGRDDDD